MDGDMMLEEPQDHLPASPHVSQSSKGSGRRAPNVKDDSRLLLPFKQGWRREVVQRGITSDDKPGAIRADAYYFSPCGKKLRSIVEVERHLKEMGSDLGIEAFSFFRRSLGAPAPGEIVRRARPTTVGAAAAAQAKLKPYKTPLQASRNQNKVPKKRSTMGAITLGKASSVIQMPGAAGGPLQKAPLGPLQKARRHSLMEKSRRAFAWKALELKKKAPVFQTAQARAQKARASVKAARPAEERVRIRRPWLLAEVDETGHLEVQPPDVPTTVEYYRLVEAAAAPHAADQVSIGQRRLSAPCSLFCFFASAQSPLALPTAQCLVCRCLSHPDCVGVETECSSFVCVDCYKGVAGGDGFDGIGDSVAAHSDSGSDLESDASVEEYIPPLTGGFSGAVPVVAAGMMSLPLPWDVGVSPWPETVTAGVARGAPGSRRSRGRARGQLVFHPPQTFGTRPLRGRGSRGPRGARAALAASLGRGVSPATAPPSARTLSATPSGRVSDFPACEVVKSPPGTSTGVKPPPLMSSSLKSAPALAANAKSPHAASTGVKSPSTLSPYETIPPRLAFGKFACPTSPPLTLRSPPPLTPRPPPPTRAGIARPVRPSFTPAQPPAPGVRPVKKRCWR